MNRSDDTLLIIPRLLLCTRVRDAARAYIEELGLRSRARVLNERERLKTIERAVVSCGMVGLLVRALAPLPISR